MCFLRKKCTPTASHFLKIRVPFFGLVILQGNREPKRRVKGTTGLPGYQSLRLLSPAPYILNPKS